MTFSRRIVNLFLVFISSTTLAQNATVSGKVTDVNGESIPFANVVAVEHGVGSSTDFDGNFRFTVPTGKSTIYCSFVGYKNDTIVVQLSAGQKYQKNFVLRENDNNLQEIEVIATRRTNTDIAVMMEVKQAKQIVNAISAEMIEKTQDSDASEVVKRIPGVTVVGNNFIMIRGLSERYNNVMLHDVFAPSMETDVKSFAFDIIPSNMIDRILIFKSPAPEITGEFAGGVVKIYTKGIPDSTFTSVSVSSTYRNGTSFKDFKQPRKEVDCTGQGLMMVIMTCQMEYQGISERNKTLKQFKNMDNHLKTIGHQTKEMP
jgi:outer membrane cobalamin receptor